MKKIAWLTASIAMLALIFMACPNEPKPKDPTNNPGVITNPRVVTFDLNGHGTHASATGGATSWTVTVASGTAVAKPADPTDSNFDFKGWFLNPDDENASAFDFSTPISIPTTLKAKWEVKAGVNTFKVYFYANGAAITGISARDVVAGEKTTAPTQTTVGSGTDTRDIIGWYKDADLTTVFDFAAEVINAETIIHAKLRTRMTNFEWKNELTYDAPAKKEGADPYSYWNLSDATLTALIAASKNDPPASKMRLHFYTEAEDFADWGFGKFGYAQTPPTPDITFGDFSAPSGGNHFQDVWVTHFVEAYADILFVDGDKTKATVSPLPKIAVRTWIKDDDPNAGGTVPERQKKNTALKGIELWTSTNNAKTPEIVEDEPPVAVPDKFRKGNRVMIGYQYVQDVSTTTSGDLDISTGKGEIAGDDLLAIKDVGSTGRLRFYIRNMTAPSYANRNNWGIGQIGGYDISCPNDSNLLGSGAVSGDLDFEYPTALGRQLVNDVLQTAPDRLRDLVLEVALSNISGLDSLTSIFCNIWNQMAIVHCELWEVDPNASSDRPATVNLVAGEYHDNYRAELKEDWVFNGGQIIEGDRYELTYKFTADKAISKLDFQLVDTSEDAGKDPITQEGGWWNELSDKQSLTSIAPATVVEGTITFIATDSALTAAAACNALVIHADIAGGPFKLEFSNIKIAKVPVGGNLGDFSNINNARQKGWTNSDVGYADIKAAKYLVVKVIPEELDEIGALTLWFQGGGKPGGGNFDWAEPSISGKAEIEREPGEAVYIVIDLDAVSGWRDYADAVSGWAQFGLGGLAYTTGEPEVVTGLNVRTLLAAWITDEDLSDPTTASVAMVPATGYFVLESDWAFDLDD
jgi:hypothetical protein